MPRRMMSPMTRLDEDDIAILDDQSGFSPMEAWAGAAGSATTMADPSFQSELQAIDSAIISVSQQEAPDARRGENDTRGSYDRAQEYPCPPPETPETPATGGSSESHPPAPDKVGRYKQLFAKVQKVVNFENANRTTQVSTLSTM